MAGDQTRSWGDRAVHAAQAAAVGGVLAWTGAVTDAAGAMPGTGYDTSPAVEISKHVQDIAEDEFDRRRESDELLDAIENPQQAPLYSDERPVDDVPGDVEDADLAEDLDDALGEVVARFAPDADSDLVDDDLSAELAESLGDVDASAAEAHSEVEVEVEFEPGDGDMAPDALALPDPGLGDQGDIGMGDGGGF